MNPRLMTTEDARKLIEARAAVQPTPQEKAPDAASIAANLAAQVEGHRARVNQAEEALQQEQDALAGVAQQLEAAQAARDQRQRKIVEYEQQAAQVAQETITAGRAEVSQAEQDADAQAERLRRELARADAVLTTLQTQQQEAAQRVHQARQAVAQAQADLERAQVEEHGAQLRARTTELAAELRQIVAEGRQHNRQVVEVTQRWAQAYGHATPTESQARATAHHLLYLPGADQAQAQRQQRNTSQVVPDGVSLDFAPDLTSSEVSEDMLRRAMP